MICYHCHQNIILPDDAEIPLRAYDVKVVMCCLRDADMDEHIFFFGPSEVQFVGLPAQSITQDGQLQAIKRLFSSCSLASVSKAAYLNISKEHYVYLLSDMQSRAMLLKDHDEVLEKHQRIDRGV